MSSRNATRRLRVAPAIVPTVGRVDDDGPTDAELAAIAAETPLIDAEVALTDAEIRTLLNPYPSELDWRRVRRARQRVEQELRAYLAHARSTATPNRRSA